MWVVEYAVRTPTRWWWMRIPAFDCPSEPFAVRVPLRRLSSSSVAVVSKDAEELGKILVLALDC